MPVPVNHPFNEAVIYAYAANISAAASAFARVPFRGKVVKVGSVIYNPITVADNTVTTRIASSAITGGVITITQSGSAAGQVNTATPAGLNLVNEDDAIEFAYTGSTTACPAMFFAVIRAG